MHRLASVLALLLFSCGPTTRPDFVIHLVDGAGSSPFSSRCLTGSIRIDVAQGTNAVLTTNGSIGSGPISVEIPSYGLLTQIQVTASCTGEEPLIGSTPEFVPVGFGFVNIVLGRPSECISIQQPTLVPPMIAPQLVRLGVNVVVMGGLTASRMPNLMLQGFDTLSFTHNAMAQSYPALPTAMGLGRAVRISDTRILFVSTPTSGVYDTARDLTTRYSAIQDVSSAAGLHVGAGAESALVELGSGLAVVGGATGDDASNGITWITVIPNGLQVTRGQLTYARRRPAAVFFEPNRLLVAGGQGPGEPLFEVVTVGSLDPAIPFETTITEQRYAPVLTTDLLHAHALLLLGSSDALDSTMQQTTTYEVMSCRPTGCTVAMGTPFPDAPRADVAVVEHHVGGTVQGSDDYETLLIGGLDTTTTTATASPLVDRIHFDGTQFTIVPAGMLLAARRSPGASEVGGGVVLTGGGADDRPNALGTLELCFPEHLAPITSL